jgi:small-conductance mechanosensitive channel
MGPTWLDALRAFSAEQLGAVSPFLWRIGATLGAMVLFTIAQGILARALSKTVSDPAVRYGANKTARYGLGLVVLAVIARIWIEKIAGLATYFGLLSAGLAVALQEPIANLFGFGFILWRRPFDVGDRIEIGAHTGDVVDVRLFQFTLLEVGNWVRADQSTGRVIHVPNGWVFRHATANYSRGLGHIWNELPVTITFESDWRLAKQILTRVLNESALVTQETIQARIDAAQNRYFIKHMNLTPIVWTEVSTDGVVLTLRYLCDPRNRRASAGDLWEKILEEFATLPGVDFAYPTTRQFRNPVEGKSSAGGPPQKRAETMAERPPYAEAGGPSRTEILETESETSFDPSYSRR